MRRHSPPLGEPTPEELSAIEAEWPLIEAELSVLDAEITILKAADHGGPSPLDWRRLRRAEARVIRVAAQLAARPNTRQASADNLPGRCTVCGDPLAWVAAPGSDRIHAWSGRLGLPERPYDHTARPGARKAVA